MIPEILKIGGHYYKVEVKPGLAESEGALALCDFERQVISIERGAPPTLKQECLLHEIIEAVNFHCGLNLPHRAIDVLGGALHQALSDNRLRFY